MCQLEGGFVSPDLRSGLRNRVQKWVGLETPPLQNTLFLADPGRDLPSDMVPKPGTSRVTLWDQGLEPQIYVVPYIYTL